MAIVINGSGTVTGLAVGGLPDGTVDAGTLATNSVDSAELIDGAVDNSHLADDAVGLAEMASGTDGNIISYDASGNPVAIATGSDGQVLTSTGAGSPPAFEDAASGGITEADSWKLTTNFTPGSGQQYILSNWARASETGFGKLGTGMSQSSGIFTFPSTGVWEIIYHINIYSSAVSGYIHMNISTTTDNSTYANGAVDFGHIDPGARYIGLHTRCLFDVTNTSTHKCKIGHYIYDPTNATVLENRTDVIFKKLGET